MNSQNGQPPAQQQHPWIVGVDGGMTKLDTALGALPLCRPDHVKVQEAIVGFAKTIQPILQEAVESNSRQGARIEALESELARLKAPTPSPTVEETAVVDQAIRDLVPEPATPRRGR